MKVSHAIKLLSEINPDEEIAISWWERDLFTTRDGTPVSDSAWAYAVEGFDANGGYDTINQQVWEFINYDIKQEGEF
jgi:hypothetical protein